MGITCFDEKTPDVLERAFDPFFSHRPAGRGRVGRQVLRDVGLVRCRSEGGQLRVEDDVAPGVSTHQEGGAHVAGQVGEGGPDDPLGLRAAIASRVMALAVAAISLV